MSIQKSKFGFLSVALCASLLMISACSRQQSDWEKTRTANNIEAYQQFLKKYPAGEFTTQAQARVKELTEEHDWQKARDADTPEAYQAFLKQYPEGKWAEEARIRVENFSLAHAPAGAPAGTDNAADSAASSGGDTAANSDETPSAGTAAPAPKSAATSKSSTAANSSAASKSNAAPVPRAHPGTAGVHKAASAKTGRYLVQLAAFKSGPKGAEKAWLRLQQRHPHALNGVTHRVVAIKTSKGKLYRLQGIDLSSAKAHSICASIRSKSQSCIVAVQR